MQAGYVLWLPSVSAATFGCIHCNAAVREGILNDMFWYYLVCVLSVLGLVAIFISFFHFWWTRLHDARSRSQVEVPSPAPFITTAVILGVALGGFIDGIVFHQILQWHQMLSHRIPPVSSDAKSINMFWDGLFHACMFILLLIGIARLHLHRNDRLVAANTMLVGGALVGWGMFNVLEGIMDHHILKLHIVREVSANHSLWNYGFLIVSIVMASAGYYLIQRAVRRYYSG